MNLLGSRETWVLLCFAVAGWILPKVQLYIPGLSLDSVWGGGMMWQLERAVPRKRIVLM